MFQGFDGLMALSRREGVDIRPTLLRVLTDLYVQTDTHTDDEEVQFVELASRLIDVVDDATRAAVRARLSVYPRTPHTLQDKLGLSRPSHRQDEPVSPFHVELSEPLDASDIEIVDTPEAAAPRIPPTLSMQPHDASSLNTMFQMASSWERVQILHGLADAPLTPATRIDPRRAARALAELEQTAMVADLPAFTAELGDALILPAGIAAQITSDPHGEPLACAAKVLGMSSAAFQRVLLFLNPAIGSSVMDVYRLARMYDNLSERAALIMLAAWRGSSLANLRAKYRPALYDDERRHGRTTHAQPRPHSAPPMEAEAGPREIASS